MSMIDVLTRVDAICKKYDRYDGDPFSRIYAAVDAEVDAAIEKSARAAKEKNRAASVTLNADVRRSKMRLLEEVVTLQKIAAKKVKRLSPEEKVLRCGLIWWPRCHTGSRPSPTATAAAAPQTRTPAGMLGHQVGRLFRSPF